MEAMAQFIDDEHDYLQKKMWFSSLVISPEGISWYISLFSIIQ